MSEVTLYLHIGATKTGSTALQRFLEQSFSRLLHEFRVLYPNFHDKDVYTPMRPGYNYWQGQHFENSDGSRDLDLFNHCVQYCKANSLRSIVISHEALLMNWLDRVGLLSNKIDANIKIICYVRRQDYHLESAWNQIGHKLCSSSEIMTSLKTNDKWGGWRPVSWYEKIEPWANYFGEENIIVRPYEKEQMPNGIVPDFLNIINVAWSEELKLNNRDDHYNRGFSRDVLELLYLNRDSYPDLGDQRLSNMLNSLLSDEYKKKPFDSYQFLSPQERIELLNEYEASNQMVAKKYLHREDGRLFYEPFPSLDAPWEPYGGLTVEQLTPIITSMIYTLHKRQTALMQKDQALSAFFKKWGLDVNVLTKIKRWLVG
jgi:hypothetical protein